MDDWVNLTADRKQFLDQLWLTPPPQRSFTIHRPFMHAITSTIPPLLQHAPLSRISPIPGQTRQLGSCIKSTQYSAQSVSRPPICAGGASRNASSTRGRTSVCQRFGLLGDSKGVLACTWQQKSSIAEYWSDGLSADDRHECSQLLRAYYLFESRNHRQLPVSIRHRCLWHRQNGFVWDLHYLLSRHSRSTVVLHLDWHPDVHPDVLPRILCPF